MAERRFEDAYEIERLLVAWSHARDYGDWDALAACFHDDATVRMAWIAGPARDYVAHARAGAKTRDPRTSSKHIITNPLIHIAGDRAFSICHALLSARRIVEGVEIDLESWFRIFDLLERRDGRWAIFKRTGIYEKDRISPVDPAGFPEGFWDGVDMSQFPPNKRFYNVLEVKSGKQPNTGYVQAYSAEETALHEEGRRWVSSQ